MDDPAGLMKVANLTDSSDGRFDTKVLDTSIPRLKFLVSSNVQVLIPVTTPLFLILHTH